MDELLNEAPCGYVRFDDRAGIIAVNATLCRWLGYSEEELRQLKVENLLNVAGKIFFQTHFFPLLKLDNKAEEIFLSLAKKDGGQIPVVVNASRKEEERINTLVCIPVHNRRKYEDEILEARRKAEKTLEENQELRELRARADQHVLELDRKLSQLNAINAELVEFSNIVHHDMKECIRKIVMFIKLYQAEREESYLSKIEQFASRLRAINAGLDVFIHLGITEDLYQPTDLNEELRLAKREVERDFGVKIGSLTHDPLPEIPGNPSQLRLLFYQLLSNSVKFRKDDAVQVHISAAQYEDNLIHSKSDYHYGEVLHLRYSDNSKGFESKFSEYVFRLLKKTQKNAEGMGFGLAVCRKIVSNHHGIINIASSPGEGVKLEITLPILRKAAKEGKENQKSESI